MSDRAGRVKANPPRLVTAGEVYLVDDDVLMLPGNPARKPHEKRPVIVLQSENISGHAQQNTVLIAPCSTTRQPGPYDHEFPSENGFTRPDISVFTTLVQPVLKADLTNRQGKITDDGLRTLLTKIAVAFGFSSALDLGTLGQGAAEVPDGSP